MSARKNKRVPGLRAVSRKPFPQVARRLRVAFPELWTRYRVIESARDFDSVRLPIVAGRNRPVRPS